MLSRGAHGFRRVCVCVMRMRRQMCYQPGKKELAQKQSGTLRLLVVDWVSLKELSEISLVEKIIINKTIQPFFVSRQFY